MWSFFTRDVVKDFGYEIGAEQNSEFKCSLWKLHAGKKKSTGEAVSVFVFEAAGENQSSIDIAKGSVKRLKTLRHPSILTYIDSLETDKLIYLVTEKVVPLALHLSQNEYTESQKELAISWGLYHIAFGLKFLNKDCNLSHNNVCLSSVFVDHAGEYRLFGFEYIAPCDERPPTRSYSDKEYVPPELGGSTLKNKTHNWSYDSWGFGCLIWEIFNGLLPKSSSLNSTGKIPSNLATYYSELVDSNPQSRLSSLNFVKKASKPGGYFKNRLVDVMLFLREIHIKDSELKTRFFTALPSGLATFPQDISLYKILPELINAFEFGNAGSSVLMPIFQLGKLLSDEEYQQKIVPCIIKMFSSKDRTTRARLLKQMGSFIHHLSPAVINAQIFPNVAQGFLDTNPVIRENTIKCMLHLAPKLNYQNLNEEMLKHFARLQTKDDQGGIRTNTTVCLGKIASYLHPQARKKILINAFLRALRDPFPPARASAILAFSATEQYYSINDCATRVLPALCHFTVDPDKSVRDQAFKAIDGFLQKLQKVSEDPSLIEEMEKELQSMTPSEIAASWTSWAVTSLVDKLHMPSLSKSTSSPTVNSTDATATAKVPDVQNKVEEKDASSGTAISSKKLEIPDDWNSDWNDEDISAEVPQNDTCVPQQPETAGGEWDVDDWESFDNMENIEEENPRLKDCFPKTKGDDVSQSITPTKDSPLRLSSPNKQINESWNIADDQWDSWGSEVNSTESKNAARQQKQNEDRLLRDEKRKQKIKERQLAKPKKLGAQKLS